MEDIIKYFNEGPHFSNDIFSILTFLECLNSKYHDLELKFAALFRDIFLEYSDNYFIHLKEGNKDELSFLVEQCVGDRFLYEFKVKKDEKGKYYIDKDVKCTVQRRNRKIRGAWTRNETHISEVHLFDREENRTIQELLYPELVFSKMSDEEAEKMNWVLDSAVTASPLDFYPCESDEEIMAESETSFLCCKVTYGPTYYKVVKDVKFYGKSYYIERIFRENEYGVIKLKSVIYEDNI